MLSETFTHLTLALLAASNLVQAASTGWEPAAPPKGRCKINVKPPQTIQSAIDAAKPGDTICISGDTYSEQLLITKNGISLIGSKGTVLVPPGNPSPNFCSTLIAGAVPPAQAGICIAGADVVFGACPFPEKCKVSTVGRYVKGVSIQGLEIRGFGLNIATVGGDNTQILDNTLIDGGYYGSVSVGSYSTKTKGNIVKTSGKLAFIAICNDNFNGAETRDNQIMGYNVGICVQTSGSTQERNTIGGCCAGAVVDPLVKNAKVKYNKIGKIDAGCIGTWPIIGGIWMTGSTAARIEGNTITDQLTGMSPGIAVIDGFDGTPANNNLVKANILSNNDVDIYFNTTGTGNQAVNNQCSKSFPLGFC